MVYNLTIYTIDSRCMKIHNSVFYIKTLLAGANRHNEEPLEYNV